jgi:GT2 family glycosyltransferase
MYHDDLDISLKTRLAGYSVILAPHSKLFHKYEFERSVRMLYYMERNRLISFFSFYSVGKILLLSPYCIAMSLGMTAFSVINSWLGTKMKVDAYFLKKSSWREIIKNRKHLRRIAKVSFSKISRSFVGKIEFQEIDNPVLKYLVNPVFDFCWQIIKK